MEVEHSRFQRDLSHRPSVMPIRIPPLRQRPGDAPLLAQHFVEISAPARHADVDLAGFEEKLARYRLANHER
jgi:transcriptional regulator with GAF, ATPase, and Fis domain